VPRPVPQMNQRIALIWKIRKLSRHLNFAIKMIYCFLLMLKLAYHMPYGYMDTKVFHRWKLLCQSFSIQTHSLGYQKHIIYFILILFLLFCFENISIYTTIRELISKFWMSSLYSGKILKSVTSMVSKLNP